MTESSTIDYKRYLERINYRDEIYNSIEVLTKLQHLHLLNVPFENLDIHLGRRIEFSNNFEKIVNRRRGGFCYELNGLFFQLLQALGFEVKLISARVHGKENEFSPEFDHMAIVANVNGANYLVDVGFGEFAYSPLKIEMDILQTDRAGNFMFTKHESNYWSICKFQQNDLIPEYIFTETSRDMGDFLERCNYHQTSPLSHFTQKRLCTIVTEKGRMTISGDRLKRTEGGKITETELVNEEEFNRALWEYFSIRL